MSVGAPGGRQLLTVLALTVGGCGHGGAGPASAIDAYATAVERRDYAAAYALMSAPFREQMTQAEFERQLQRDGAELTDDARALRSSTERWAGWVEVVLPGGDRVAVVREGSAWRLDSPPLDPYGQGTPRAALRAFVRAVESKRYDVLLRLAPARFRGAVTVDKLRAFWEGNESASNRALLRELRLNLGARIAEEGDEAFMTYGTNRQVRFVREGGLWRIENPE